MRKINASINKVKGNHNKFFRECVGSGHAYLGLRADYQRHLSVVAKECGFKFLRFHGLLHDDMGVYRENKNGNPVYNWQYIDILYDYIINLGMKPFVELGFMPAALASGEKTVFYWKGNVTPPNCYTKWENLIYELVMHLTERYGIEEVKTWYFEVWNEPNHPSFFSSGIEDYLKMYSTAAKAVKNVCQDYKVGGPATAGNAWVPELINHCHKNRAPLDFVSTHTYGVEGHLDEFGTKLLYLISEPGEIIDQVKDVTRQVKESSMPELEIHYTEWSSSYSPRDPVHDHYIIAPYILSKLKGVEGYVDSMSYWTFSDVFEETGPPPSPFHGGFGLLNLQGLKKPSYLAYKFMNMLGDKELLTADDNSWICSNDSGVQILLWDYTYLNQEEPNQSFYKKDIPAKYKDKINILISDLEPGVYELRLYKVGYKINDVYTAYLHMGSPSTLTSGEVSLLKEASSDKPIYEEEINVKDDRNFVFDIDLNENDVILVTLTGRQ